LKVLAPLTGFARYQRPLARGGGLRLNASRRVTGELGWDTIGERDIYQPFAWAADFECRSIS